MSIFTSYAVWGKFFVLESYLNYIDQAGYSLNKICRYRIPPIAEFQDALFLKNNGSSLNIVLNNQSFAAKNTNNCIYIGDVIQTPLAKISKSLNKKILWLEFNFDNLIIHTAEESNTIKLLIDGLLNPNVQKRFFNSLNVNADSIYNANYYYPVIAKDFEQDFINLIQIDLLTEGLISDADQFDQIVFTGERVWSGWLNSYLISRLLDSLLITSKDIHIDYQGIWQLLIYGSKLQSEVFKLEKSFFEPNFSFIKNHPLKIDTGKYTELNYYKQSIYKKIILEHNKPQLFDLKEKDYLLDQNQKLARMVYVSLNKYTANISLSDLAKDKLVWKKLPYEQQLLPEIKIFDYNLVQKSTEPFDFIVPKNLETKLFQKINVGDLLGTVEQQQLVCLDYRNVSNLKDNLLCVEGQIIQKGQALVNVRNRLIKKDLLAPVSGKLILDKVHLGYVFIEVDVIKKPLKSPFAGKLVERRGQNLYRVETETIEIYVQETIGSAFYYGYLAKRGNLNTPDPKILFLENLADYDLDLDLLQKYNIKGILAQTSSFDTLQQFSQRAEMLMGFINLTLIEPFESYNPYCVAFLNKFYGSFVTIRGHKLIFTLNPINSVSNSRAITDGLDLVKEELSDYIGSYAKNINYLTPTNYVRIIGNSNQKILIKHQGKLSETSLDNLFYSHYGK